MLGTRAVCFDRRLSQDLNARIPHVASQRRDRPHRALASPRRLWVNGSTLRVCFLGGTPEEQQLVERHASEWSEYGNIRFDFGDDPASEIRVSFEPELGSWSFVGKDCLSITRPAATMNLASVDTGTILHQFGHALGLEHEYAIPEGGILWNEEAVYRDMAGPPNHWSRSTTFHLLIQRYGMDHFREAEFDPESIMLYQLPSDWALNLSSGAQPSVLSAADKRFIGSVAAYPRVAEQRISDLTVTRPIVTEGEVGRAGEEDLFRFDVNTPGEFMVEAIGPTDLSLCVFGPDSQTNLVSCDDASRDGISARVVVDLVPGTYYVQVRHYNLNGGTGRYRVHVTAR